MFLDGLDELDQKILTLLIHNARMSYSDIGEQVGISRVAVKMRIRSLEERGVIEEYTTVINPQDVYKRQGIISIDPKTIEVAKGLGLTKWKRLFRIELPIAAPFIMSGIRISAVAAVGTLSLIHI